MANRSLNHRNGTIVRCLSHQASTIKGAVLGFGIKLVITTPSRP
jgi:hypothetical protein